MGKIPMHINSGETKSSNQLNQPDLSIMPNTLEVIQKLINNS